MRLAALARLFRAACQADPPRARRRPRHRRRAARADRAGGEPRRAHLHRPAVVSAQRHAGPAPQARAGRPPAAPARRVPVPRTRPTRCSTSAPRSNLHRRVGQYFTGGRPARPDERDGGAGRIASTTSSARTPWRRGCANCGCWPPTRRRTTAGRGFRTAGGGWCSPTRRSPGCRWCAHRGTTASRARSASAPTPSRRPFCWPGSPECAPAPPGWRGRRCTGRPAPSVRCRRVRPPGACRPPTTHRRSGVPPG